MRSWTDPQKTTTNVKERKEGSKDEEEPSMKTIPYGNLGAEH